MKKNIFDLKPIWTEMGFLTEFNVHHLALYLTDIRENSTKLLEILDNKIIKGTLEKDMKILHKGIHEYNAWIPQLISDLKDTSKILENATTPLREKIYGPDKEKE